MIYFSAAVFVTPILCVNTVIFTDKREDCVYWGKGAGELDTFVNQTRPFLAMYMYVMVCEL